MRLAPIFATAAALAALGSPALASKASEAEAAFAADRDQDAVRLYGEAIAEAEGKPEAQGAAYFGRGEVQAIDGHAEPAIADFTAALALQKDPAARANSYFSRGESLSRRRRWEEAIADYSEAIKLAPQMSGVHFARGRALRALNRTEEALKDYEAELKLDPDSYRAQSSRADVLGLPPPPETHPHER